MAGAPLVLVMLVVAVGVAAAERGGKLQQGFYEQSCPRAEQIVKDYVEQQIPREPSVAATLIRTHFHDCFVRGCDASVLLNATTGGGEAEKDAAPNLTLRGFDFLDRVKALVEQECPGVVSCADILALASRDAVGIIGGPFWRVPTGRRDGRVSIKQEALDQLPAPTMNFTDLLASFRAKGLGVADLVWLSGAHTIGISHCNFFSERLYNFTGHGGPGDADPSLDAEYAASLRRTNCTTPTDNTTIVEMDPGSFLTFDLSYYHGLLQHQGLFQSDAALITNAAARADVESVAKGPPEVFFQVFARSMMRMGMIEVKTGGDGEIRRHCAVVNN
ncbi:peroxidase 39-like [Triticum dicoccoides]|uniref:peroxidase 39-like n=1 Tax=Triticum dicoccoides TaxID=85692 RepID=UPI000E7A176B|nr:peroxidase 39-like [Triticum dicoccoides]